MQKITVYVCDGETRITLLHHDGLPEVTVEWIGGDDKHTRRFEKIDQAARHFASEISRYGGETMSETDDEMADRLGAIDIEEDLDYAPSRYSTMVESGLVDQ